MLVKDIMAKKVISVQRSTTFRELLAIFKNFHLFPMVPVVEENNKLVGIVSFRDFDQHIHPCKQ